VILLRLHRSVTLVKEADHKVLKAAAAAKEQRRRRVLLIEAMQHWPNKLPRLGDDISEVLHEEERQLHRAEMEL
jgi:hypothetical protein